MTKVKMKKEDFENHLNETVYYLNTKLTLKSLKQIDPYFVLATFNENHHPVNVKILKDKNQVPFY